MPKVSESPSRPADGEGDGSRPATTWRSQRLRLPKTRVVIAAVATIALLTAGAVSIQAASASRSSRDPVAQGRVPAAHEVVPPKVASPPVTVSLPATVSPPVTVSLPETVSPPMTVSLPATVSPPTPLSLPATLWLPATVSPPTTVSLPATVSPPATVSRVAASASGHPPLAKPGYVILGAFTELPGLTEQVSVTTREAQLGRKYALNSHYYDWADPFPGPAESADTTAGRTPMDTWWGIDPRQIVNGSQDGLITTRAKAVAAYGRPMFLRWGAEMNGNWYAWSGTKVGNDPTVFVAAWRHIHDIFTAVGVHNAAWVWAPNADSHPGGTDVTSWNSWRNYYPGDAYVDWVGIDGYNWGATDSWQSFGQVVGPVYADYAGRKPIMIAETGSLESGGNKAAWLAEAAVWIKAHRSVMAFVYFDTNQSSSGLDWRVDSSAASLGAYIAVARDPYFSAHPG